MRLRMVKMERTNFASAFYSILFQLSSLKKNYLLLLKIFKIPFVDKFSSLSLPKFEKKRC